MALILDALSWALLGAGSLVLILAATAILRMPTFYTRLHAAGVNETLGPALILSGLALQVGDFASGAAFVEILFKLVLVLTFLVITSPVASHALARASLENGIVPESRRRPGIAEPPSPGASKISGAAAVEDEGDAEEESGA